MIETVLSGRRLRAAGRFLACAVLCGAFVIGRPEAVTAAALAEAKGPVVLTIAGNIAESNRPAFAEEEDAFLKYHEKSFSKAAEFDLAMLESLGLQEVVFDLDGWSKPMTLMGPRLADVLAAAGAAGRDITVVALDGFGSEISAEDIAAEDWIVGLSRDGRYLGIGQRGPLWVVYGKRDGSALTAEDELRWPWAAFFIEVK